MANPMQIFDENGQNSLKVNPDGSINVTANVSIQESDIQIGAVEIKDGSTQARASVDQTYGLKVDVSRVQGGTINVTDGGGSLTVDGTVNIGNSVTVGNTVSVSDGGTTLSIDDNGGSITVDGVVSLGAPVTISGTVPISDAGGSITVDGTVNIGNSVTIGAPVEISGTIPVSDAGGSLTVDGTVSIGNTVTVSDGNGSLTVDGTVTVQDGGGSLTVDDGGSSLTVDGTVNVGNTVVVSDGNGSLTVDGTVNVGNVVPISDNNGSITIDGNVGILGTVPVSDNGGSLTVDGSVSIVGTPTRTQTFTLQNAASATGNGTVADVTGYATGVFAVTITGTATVTVEFSQDGSTWNSLGTFIYSTSGQPSNIFTSSRVGTATIAGYSYIRARISSYISGTITVSLYVSLSEIATPSGAIATTYASSDAVSSVTTSQATGAFNLAFNGSSWDRLRSVNTGQLKTSLYGATGNALAINADGSLNVNTNADIQIGAVEIKDATTDTRVVVDATYGMAVDVKRGTVTVQDGGGSITVDDGGGSLTVDGAVTVSNTVNIADGGSSISIDDNGGSITVDGSVSISNASIPVTDNGGSLTVDSVQLPATLTTAGNLKVAIQEGGFSGSVQITDGTDNLVVNADGSLNVSDGGNSLTVDGTVNIGNAVSISGTVPVSDGGGSLTVDGSVSISNAVSISGAVPVTDNGGSLTVDGTVTIQDGGNTITVDTPQLPNALTASGYLKVSVLENTTNQTVTIQDGGNVISVDDAGGSLTVDSGQLPTTLTGSGNLKVALSESGATVNVADGGGSLTVDGTVGVSGTVTTTEAAAQMQTFTMQNSAGAVGNGTVADITGLDVLTVQTTITGTATVTFEQSNDNSSWHVAVGQLVTTAGALVSSATASNVYKFSVSGMKYFRSRVSAWTSGTVSAVGYGTTGNQVFIPITAQYGSVDTSTTGHYLQGVGAYNLIYDGTNFARQRGVQAVSDASNGTGIISNGLYGFNGTTWDRVRTVNTGQLKTSLYGATGNALAINADGSLNVNTNADIQIGAVEIKDGTTDTRAVVDSTYGLKVDVSRVGGTVTIQDGGNTITVDGSVTVADGGSSLTIDSTQLPAALTASGNFKVSIAEDSTVLSVDDNGGSLTIDSAQLPSTLTGSGNLKVSLSESAATVTVADGGGSITTDSAQLPSALTGSGNLKVALSESAATVNIADGGGSITVDGTVTVGNASIPVTDNGGSLTVDSAQLPTALTAGGNLKVAIQEGGLTGSTSNASDGVATSSTNLGTVGYLYGFNGTAWDRLRLDGSDNLKIALSASTATVNVADGGGSLTVDGTVAISNASIAVTDNGGSLTVDSAQLPTALSAGGNLKVDVQNYPATQAVSGTVTVGNSSIPVTDNGGSLTVDDGGSSLTVDGTVAISNASIAVTDNGGSLTIDSAQLPTALTAGGNFKVAIQEGGFSGSVSNASDSVATSSTNIGAVSYMYGFDGTNWDRLRVDANNNLNVNVNSNTAKIGYVSTNFFTARTTTGVSTAFDADGYNNVVIKAVCTGSINFSLQYSHDNVTFTSLPAQITPNGQSNTSFTVGATTVSYYASIPPKSFIRVIVNTVTSGAITLDGFFSVQSEFYQKTSNGSMAVTLQTNTGIGLSATSFADATSNSTANLLASSFNLVFNGTTWDRVRSASGDALAATGIQGAGNLLFNGSTWDRARTATGDGLAATGLQAAALVGFNGTTWDRLRVDASKNLNVNLAKATSGSTTLFNAVTTTGTSAAVSVDGYASAFVSVETGPNFNTNFKLEGTIDGTKWWTLRGLDYESGLIDGLFQGDRSIHYNISGLLQIRGNITAIVGTTTVKLRYQTTEVSIGLINTSAFPTTFTIMGTNGYLEPNYDGSIAIGDGMDVLAINTDGSINITDNGGSITVDGTVAISNSSIAVTDGGGTLTVDGGVSNASDSIATSSTNIGAVSYLYGFDGTNWDRLKVDASANLLGKVNAIGKSSSTHTFQNAAIAVGNGTSFDCSSFASVTVLLSISSVATVTFEGSFDNSTFFQVSAQSVNSGIVSPTVSDQDYTAGAYIVDTTGFSYLRARISSFTSGTVTVTGRGSVTPYNPTAMSPQGKNDVYSVNVIKAQTGYPTGTAIECIGYNFVVFKVTAGSATITFETSPDNVTYTAFKMYQANNGLYADSQTFTSQTLVFYAYVPAGLWIRPRVTGWSSGNTTVWGYFYSQYTQTPWTTSGSSGGFPRFVLTSPNGQDMGVTTYNADTIVSTAVQIGTAGFALSFNGSQWERTRTASADALAAVGIQAAGQMGWNGASFDRIRVNNKHVYQEYLLLTNGQHLDIWTPVLGKKFRLMTVMIGSRTAAELILRDAANSTTFSNIATFNLGGRDTLTFDFRNGYLSSAVNNKVAVYNQTGSTVALWATFIGTEE